MRQLATQPGFLETAHEVGSSADSRIFDFNRILLLALERALEPPIVHSHSTLQPMRIIVVNAALPRRVRAGEHGGVEMPRLLPRALPAVVGFSNEPARLSRRAVRGEILSDEHGRLYEKLGRHIRPIHQLASGPAGEVLDLLPNAKADLPAAASTQPHGPASTQTPGQQQAQEQIKLVSHRKLFADPGQWRVVWWGEFKEILAHQLAHPERLRDTYRLPCYVQVIEIERAVSIAELASIYKSEKEPEARLYLLTDEIAAKLDLVLPLRPAPLPDARRTPNTLAAHERVFRLLTANDPTIDVATLKSKQPPLSKPEANETEAKTLGPVTAAVSVKQAIPSRFVKDWEFRISREEAIYDMNAKPTLRDLLLKIGQRLRVAKSGNEFSKWRVLLTGKEADEQLWAVRPPRGRLTDSLVREWAQNMLELGGYDLNKMIIEWEIFWRRRGV
jgi:hypothetical protein